MRDLPDKAPSDNEIDTKETERYYDMAEKSTKPIVVKIGTQYLSCFSPNDFITIGHIRWSTLHDRAQQMLEDARAEPAQRVEVLREVFTLRDNTTQLAYQHAKTIEGALEIIQHGCKKAKINAEKDIDSMSTDGVITVAFALLGIDLGATSEETDPKKEGAETTT